VDQRVEYFIRWKGSKSAPQCPSSLFLEHLSNYERFEEKSTDKKTVPPQQLADDWALTVASLKAFYEATMGSYATATIDKNEIELDGPQLLIWELVVVGQNPH
jgi:hypothetical protein